MRTLHAKSSVRSSSDQGSAAAAKGPPKAELAALSCADVPEFLGSEARGQRLEAPEVEYLLEPRPGNESKTSTKRVFLEKLEAELREWDAELDELRAKARNAKVEVRAEFEVELEAVEGDRALAQEKLQELRRHGEWAWEDLKDSADETWRELREAIKRGASLFK